MFRKSPKGVFNREFIHQKLVIYNIIGAEVLCKNVIPIIFESDSTKYAAQQGSPSVVP